MKDSLSKSFFFMISILYLGILMKIILFKTAGLSDILDGNFGGGYRSINGIPFRIFVDYGEMLQSGQWLRGVSNILGNIAIFIPTGLLLPVLFRRLRGTIAVPVTVTLVVSILFECLQYAFALGSADIDDVILNTLGGWVGVLIYRLIALMARQNSKSIQFGVLTVLIVGSIPAFFIARAEFGHMLGLTKYETVYIGNEQVPQRASDVLGTLIRLSGNQVSYYTGLMGDDETANALLEKQSATITNSTKVYRLDIESFENKSVFRYTEIGPNEFGNVDEHATMALWTDPASQTAEVVVFSKRTLMRGSLMKSEKGP